MRWIDTRLNKDLRLILLGACTCLFLGIVFGPGQNPLQAAKTDLMPRVYLPLVLNAYQAGPLPSALFGVSDSSTLVLDNTAEGLNLAVTAGVHWNRTSVSWKLTEPTRTTPDHFSWAGADHAILPLLQNGIHPLVLIMQNPAWAANTPCGPVNDPNDMAQFVGALGARYPQVQYWALYNEVDLTVYSKGSANNGGCFGEYDLNHNGIPDYADYAEMMRASTQALHAANPEAKLAFGLLAYDNFDPKDSPPGYPGGCCFGYHFLDNLLGYMKQHPLPDGEQYADVLGFNDYRIYNDNYWELHNPGDGIAAKSNALRAKMQEFGFDFPMLASEVSSFGTLPALYGISFHDQARDLSRMFTQAAETGLVMTVWWPFADFPTPPCGKTAAVAPLLPEEQIQLLQTPSAKSNSSEIQGGAATCSWWTFGIVDETLKPKLSYYAFQTAAQQLGGWTPMNFKSNNGVSTFFFAQGTRRKRVIYVKNGDPRKKQIRASWARVVDMLGNSTLLQAGASGKIRLTISMDPIFVEIER